MKGSHIQIKNSHTELGCEPHINFCCINPLNFWNLFVIIASITLTNTHRMCKNLDSKPRTTDKGSEKINHISVETTKPRGDSQSRCLLSNIRSICKAPETEINVQEMGKDTEKAKDGEDLAQIRQNNPKFDL